MQNGISDEERRLALAQMVDGVISNRSTKTEDKKTAETLARKWEHEAVQAIVYDGEQSVTVHDAIKGVSRETREHRRLWKRVYSHGQHARPKLDELVIVLVATLDQAWRTARQIESRLQRVFNEFPIPALEHIVRWDCGQVLFEYVDQAALANGGI
jgi:hypothetical protein